MPKTALYVLVAVITDKNIRKVEIPLAYLNVSRHSWKILRIKMRLNIMIDSTLLDKHGIKPSKIKIESHDDVSVIVTKLAHIHLLGLGNRRYTDGKETLQSLQERLNRYQSALMELSAEAKSVLGLDNQINSSIAPSQDYIDITLRSATKH